MGLSRETVLFSGGKWNGMKMERNANYFPHSGLSFPPVRKSCGVPKRSNFLKFFMSFYFLGKSCLRFMMRSLDFSIDLILPAAL
jgi:hypothetical protein